MGMGIGDYIATCGGMLLIGVALYNAFRTLFYPEGRGALMRLAGPVIFGVVVLAWTAMLALGFGLLYLPHLADEFRISSGLPPNEQTSYFDAVYFSFSALSSTGFGDLSAKSDPIRAITMLEGALGSLRTTLRDRFLDEIEDEGEGGDVLQQFRSDHLIAEEEAETPGRAEPDRG